MASTWTGGVSDDWDNESNWAPAGVPGAGDAILVPAAPRGGRAPEVLNGETVTVNGDVTNDDTITLASTTEDTNFVVNGGLTLSGTGKLILSDSDDNRIYATQGDSVLDVQQTIEGAGLIFSNNNLALVNDATGVVDATGANALDIFSINVENLGLLESTAGAGSLELSGAAIDNTDGGKVDSGRIAAAGGNVHIGSTVDIIGGTLSSTSGNEIDVVGAGSTLDGSKSAPVEIAAGSLVVIENGQNLSIAGVIDNDGQIELNDQKLSNTDLIVTGGVTLQGSGAVVMADDGTNNASRIYSSTGDSTLDNKETIKGAGEIFSNNNLSLLNDTTGVIDATGTHTLDLHNIAVENLNILESTGSGGLQIVAATIDNTNGGKVDSGQILAHGGKVLLGNANHIIGGALSSDLGAEIEVTAAGNVLDGAQSATIDIIKGSVIAIDNSESLFLEGVIQNDGQIQLNAAAAQNTDLVANGSVTLKGGGDVVLSDKGTVGYNRIYSTAGGSTLDNQQTIEGAGEIFSNNNLALDNDATGVVDATGAHALAVHDIAIKNANLLETTAGAGGLSLYNASIDDLVGDLVGEIIASGANTHVDINNSTIVGGKLVAQNGGVINVTAGNSDTFEGDISGGPIQITAGTVVSVLNSAVLDLGGVIQNDGQIQLNATAAQNTDLVANGNVTLKGGGAVFMSDAGAVGYNRIYSTVGGSALNNQELIAGAGEIFSNNNLTLNNDITGVVDAIGVHALALHDIKVNNAGLLDTTTGAGGLSIYNATIDDAFDDFVGEILARGAGTHVDINNSTIDGGALVAQNGGVINVTAGSSDTFDGAGEPIHITAGTVISVQNAAQLNLVGTIENDGQVQLNATAANNTDLVIIGSVTLEGAGVVVMSDKGVTGYNRIYSNTGGSNLYNQQTIEGAGEIFSNNNLTFHNDTTGVVEATGANALAVHNIFVYNSNLLETTAGAGGLSIGGATINNLADDNVGEILADGAGTHVDINNSTIVGGHLVSQNGGEIRVTAGGSVTFSGANSGGPVDIAAGSVVSVQNAAQLDLEGTIANDGELQLNATSASNTDLLVSGNVVLQGAGTVVLSDAGSAGFNRIYSDTGGSTLDNQETIEGAGEIFSNNNLSLLNDATGVIDADGANALDIHNISFTNDGVVRAENGATLQISFALSNISTDPNHTGGQILTGGTYDLIDQKTGGTGPGAASTIAIDDDSSNTITTLDATVDLAGEASTLTSNSVSLTDSLQEIGGSGVLNLYFGFNSETQQSFNDQNAVTIDQGGLVFVSGSTFSTAGLTIASGGELHATGLGPDDETATVGGAVVNDGEIVVDGVSARTQPAVRFTGAISGTGAIKLNQDAIAEFDDGVGAGQTITFGDNQVPTDAGGAAEETLKIDATRVASDGGDGYFAATVSSFGLGDVIDLTNFAGETNYSFNGTTLNINFSGGKTASLHLTGVGGSTGFQFADDGDGGTLITTGTSVELADDTGVSATDGVTDDATLTGTGDAGASLTFTDGGKTLGTTIVETNGQWSFSPTGLDDGVQTIDVSEINAAGDSSFTSISFTLATQPPNNNAPTESVSGLTNKTSETITVAPTAEDLSGVNVVSVAIIDRSTQATTAATLGAGGVYSATLTSLGDGAHVFDIVTTDTAGNTRTTPLPEVFVATEKPTVSAKESVSGTTAQTVDVITATATAESISNNAISSVLVFDGSTELGAATLINGAWTYTANNLAAREHVFSLVTTDLAGNSTTTELAPVTVIAGAGPTVSASISSPGLTNKTTETISESATAAAGQTINSVEVFDNNADLGAATFDAATGLWTFTANGLADGANDFATVTTDSAGGAVIATLDPIYVATEAPAVSPSQSLSGLTNDNVDQITETATAEAVGPNAIASVEVFDGANDLGAATLSGSVWSFAAGPLPDGANQIRTVTTDAAGNVTTASLDVIHVATKAPMVKASQSVSGLTNQNIVTITGTARSQSVAGDSIVSLVVFDGATDIGAAALSGIAYSFTTSALADGVHNLSIVAMDAAGNVTTTALAPIDVATGAQSVVVSQSLPALTNQNIDVITETVTAGAEGANAVVSVEVFKGATDLGAATLASGVWSFTTGALPDGANALLTVTTDAVGNVTRSALGVIHIATKAPVLKAAENVSGLTNQNLLAITGTAKAQSVAGDTIVSVEVFDGATHLGDATLNGVAWSFITPALSDGAHILRVTATDAAGNVATTALDVLHVATKAPVVKASESASGLTADRNITITETARAESVAGNAIASVEVFDGAIDIGAASFSNGAWTFTTQQLALGQHAFSTVTTDLAGNVKTTSLAGVDVEQTQSGVSIGLVDDTSNGSNLTNDDALAGNGFPGATVSFTIDGVAIGQTATADADGHWTFTPSGLSQGQHTIVASETNGGQTSSASLTFTYQTATPIVTIATRSATVAFPSETIDGSGEAGTTIQLYDGKQAIGAAIVVDNNGLWSESVTLANSGAHVISATDSNSAGNVGVSSAITLFLDNQIVGASDQSKVTSNQGDDHITVDPANTAVNAFGGDDTVSLTPTSDANPVRVITGSVGPNTLDLSGTSGGADVDLGLQLATGPEIGINQVYNFQNIIGGAGPETLTLSNAPGGGVGSTSGGSGGQTSPGSGGFIQAGFGDDIITGGPGDDTFKFYSAFGVDTITNFVASGANHDIFEVSQGLFANWSTLDAALSDSAAGAALSLNAAESVTFTGLTKAVLEANSGADFRFV